MYKVKGGELYYDDKSLGSADDIYVDGRQDIAGYIKKSNRKGFTVSKLVEESKFDAAIKGFEIDSE